MSQDQKHGKVTESKPPQSGRPVDQPEPTKPPVGGTVPTSKEVDSNEGGEEDGDS